MTPLSGEWRVFEPFDIIYELVYKLTTRLVGSSEIAEDPERLRTTLSIFQRFEDSGGTAGFVFPWLITPTRVRRLVTGIRLYLALMKPISERQKKGQKHSDALQYLLDEGTEPMDIIKVRYGGRYRWLHSTDVRLVPNQCPMGRRSHYWFSGLLVAYSLGFTPIMESKMQV